LETVIIKRDGRKEPFDFEKITNAILKAFKSVDGEITSESKDIIADVIIAIGEYIDKHQLKSVDIEIIQNLVEENLMTSKRKDVAREYVQYRHDRTVARKWNNDTMLALKEKLNAENVENSNANTDEKSFGGRKGEATNVVLKQFALDNCMSKKSKFLHEDNQIYIHDLSSYALGSHNCLTCPVDELLAKGFNTRQTDIRPANSVNTAFQLIAVIFQLQSLVQFGLPIKQSAELKRY